MHGRGRLIIVLAGVALFIVAAIWYIFAYRSFGGCCARIQPGMTLPEVEDLMRPFTSATDPNPHVTGIAPLAEVLDPSWNGYKVTDVCEWTSGPRYVFVGFNAQGRVCWISLYDHPTAWEQLRSWLHNHLGI